VEAQHKVSTLKVVDSLAEQALLEDVLEATKPSVPPECRHLDYLLYTPFRYRPYSQGSRFRRAGLTPGVWYGSGSPETALAEVAFYRVLFFAESPGTPFPDDPVAFTAFSAEVATSRAVDLRTGKLARDRATWEDLADYRSCQDLADAAHEAGMEVILYRSVRDPHGGVNLAVLTCAAFAQPTPVERQTWRVRIGPSGVQALREHPPGGVEFTPDEFGRDSRVQGMSWERGR
jgi:hypothetical protein